MKLAIYFLSCCIAFSWQHQHLYQHPYRAYYNQHEPLVSYYYPSSPTHHFKDYYGGNNKALLLRQLLLKQLSSKKDQNNEASIETGVMNQNDDVDNQNLAENYEAMARRVKPHHDTKKTIEASDEIQSEGRSFFLPKFLVGNQVLATSTKYTIITTSVTITTVAQCIKSSSFYGGSTQACRKRRSLLLEAANQSNLNPTPVESIETTSEAGSSFPQRSAGVDSSLLNPSRQAKAENYYTGGLFGRTITSTLTSFSLFTINTVNTVSLGSSLSCLPNGYLVC